MRSDDCCRGEGGARLLLRYARITAYRDMCAYYTPLSLS